VYISDSITGYTHYINSIEYHYRVQCKDIIDSYRIVDIDFTSLNHIVIEDNKNDIINTVLIAEDYYVKNFRYSTRYSSKLPNYKMIDVLLLLIFCPYAYFKNEGKYYHSFSLLRKSSSIEFKYLFSSQDIKEINEVRKYLNLLIKTKDQDPEIIAEYKNILIKKVLAILNKPRIRVITDIHWIKLCEKYCQELKDNVYPMNIHQSGFREPTIYEETSKQSSDFLPMLQPLKFEEDTKLLTPEGLKEIEKDRLNYERMRKKVLEKIEKVKKLYHEKQASIVCPGCKRVIGSIKNLEYVNTGTYKVNGSASLYYDVIENSQELSDNIFVTEYITYYKLIPREWITCNNCGAILGTRDPKAYFYYVYDISDLKIKIPVIDEMRSWDPKLIIHKEEILRLEAHALLERERLLKEFGEECEICGETFKDTHTFVMKHLESLKHRERLNELKDASFI
jgi:hypothetical protein